MEEDIPLGERGCAIEKLYCMQIRLTKIPISGTFRFQKSDNEQMNWSQITTTCLDHKMRP